MMINLTRVRAVVRKEFREYRRNKFIIYTMLMLPVLFLIIPLTTIFNLPASTPIAGVKGAVGSVLLLMLIIPDVLPATIAAYSVIGERDQGTLEPLLTTPIRRDEFILGKALASIIPTVIMSYFVFLVVVVSLRLWGGALVVHVLWQPAWFVAEILFVPLLATWSTWVGTAISARSSDVRVAQQLGTFASLPVLALTSLMSFQVIKPTVLVALVIALSLVVIDIGAWRVVSRMFNRERLLTGLKAHAEALNR
ncbi:MAG: ABC transporter permease [Acidimicrobiales bacterium]